MCNTLFLLKEQKKILIIFGIALIFGLILLYLKQRNVKILPVPYPAEERSFFKDSFTRSNINN